MTHLILCGLAGEETQGFLDAERSLLDELTVQKDLNKGNIRTLRLKELPASSDEEKTRGLSEELLKAFGLETQGFQTEFLSRNDFSFLAIYSSGITPEVMAVVPASKATVKRPAIRIRWQIPAIIVGVIGVLVLLYYGVGFILTRQVNSQYTGRECQGAVKLAASVEKVYPLKIAPFTAPVLEQATECQTYLEAESQYGQKKWEDAYQAYVKYSEAYPQGIYSKEARELAADSLFAWTSEQRGRQDFSSAINNLILLLESYGDTPSVSKAFEALPEVYLEWGAKHHSNGEFARAETVYLTLSDWAQKEAKQAYYTQAQVELTQTYFDWGMDLQAKNSYMLAGIKFDKVLSTDPNAGDPDSLTAKTRAYLPEFQRSWGEYLITSGFFPDAVEHYKISVELSASTDVEGAKNELTQVYLDWATSLRKGDDYYQALDKIDLAKDSAPTDATLAKVDAARETILDQFSRSKDTQAQGIMEDITKSICTNGKPITTLPIVAVLDDKRLALSGLKLSLPTNVLAQTPGDLYFVACADETANTVQTCPYSSTGFGAATHWIKRVRYDWRFKVYNAVTGKLYKEKSFSGGSPESCPSRHTFYSSTDYNYGTRPSSTTVTNWLASLLK